jgi:hypothetical protein
MEVARVKSGRKAHVFEQAGEAGIGAQRIEYREDAQKHHDGIVYRAGPLEIFQSFLKITQPHAGDRQ